MNCPLNSQPTNPMTATPYTPAQMSAMREIAGRVFGCVEAIEGQERPVELPDYLIVLAMVFSENLTEERAVNGLRIMAEVGILVQAEQRDDGKVRYKKGIETDLI